MPECTAGAGCPYPKLGGIAATRAGNVIVAAVLLAACACSGGARSPVAAPPGPPAIWYDVVTAAPDPAVVTDAGLRAGIMATKLPWRVRDRATHIEFLLVPPGDFNCGDSDGPADARPAHPVHIGAAFYLGRVEVTNAQFSALRPGHHSPAFAVDIDGADQPVANVSWEESAAFCRAAGLRLPSEMEWEYACRAGTTTAHPWGDGPDQLKGRALVLWADVPGLWDAGPSASRTRDGYRASAPVGKTGANALGFHDMIGNVWEWTSTAYDPLDYARATHQVTGAPPAVTAATERLLRGGSWMNQARQCTSSWRDHGAPNAASMIIGFRAAHDAE